VSLSCGSFHTALVTAEGEVYTWGWGQHGQLVGRNCDYHHLHCIGFGCGQSNARGSTSICSSKDPYRDGCHVLCCDLQGLGDTDDRVTPHVVEALTSTDVSLVSCGGEYTMAISGEFLIAHLYNLWSPFNRLTLRYSVYVGYTRSFHRHAARLLRHQARYCIILVFICPAGAGSGHA